SAGHPIRFSVSGANPTAADVVVVTNAQGEAQFCYTGTRAGVDRIRAVADANENGALDTTDQLVFGVATKVYKPGPPANLVLSPKTATNEVGEEHCVIATVTDRFGNPTPGVTVVFSVTGAVVVSGEEAQLGAGGTAKTNGGGEARFCYTSELPGENVITAFADTNENGQQDPGEPFDTATKTYVLPTGTPFCDVAIHDGGWILTALGDRGSFGGNAKTDSGGKVVSGSQEYTDHGPVTSIHVKSTEILAVVCEGNRATIYGLARVDRAALPYATGTFFFRVSVLDSGEPGRADTYDILVANGYYTGEDQPLQGGNIQVREG
ncbi:MAG: Ig-like domain-containing protein, partial [Actinomycetota bacterium]|nr:Ig-like domain-containing protein [Actinomycetota bacterium]